MNRRGARLAGRPIVRILVIWLVQALALLALTLVMRGLSVDGLGVALLVVGPCSCLP